MSLIYPNGLGPDAQLREMVIRILRSLFKEDIWTLQEAILRPGLSESERGAGAVKLLTSPTLRVATPVKLAVVNKDASARPRMTTISTAALSDAMKVLGKVTNTNPKILANAIKMSQKTRPIVNQFIQPKAGPPGWLGKLIQWGQVFQGQYFQWLYKHNQAAADERAGSCSRAVSNRGVCKKAGPDWKERQFTDMKGPLWGYVYAEPGCSLNVPEDIHGYAPKHPEGALYNYILWATGRGASSIDFRLNHLRDFGSMNGIVGDGRINPTPVSQSLFDPDTVKQAFKNFKAAKGPDPRWATLGDDWRNMERFKRWAMTARWLVWAAETWRANDPKRDFISSDVERKWILHTHKWGIGFVSPERLKERKLFGQNLELPNDKTAAARMDANSDTVFNTEKLLVLVMGHTPGLMDLNDFRRDTFNTLCDWPDEKTGKFAPAIHYPIGKITGYENNAMSYDSAWEAELERKIERLHAHSPIQKTVMNVARGILSVISAEIGGIASIYLDQLMAAAEGMVSDVISEILNSQLWATVSTPVGQISRLFSTTLQDKMADVWGIYDSIQDKVNDEMFDGARLLASSVKQELEATQLRFPWTGDLYGDVVPVPDKSKEILRYFK